MKRFEVLSQKVYYDLHVNICGTYIVSWPSSEVIKEYLVDFKKIQRNVESNIAYSKFDTGRFSLVIECIL